MATSVSRHAAEGPSAFDVKLARESTRKLRRFAKRQLQLKVVGTNQTIKLPVSATPLLVEGLKAISDGCTVKVLPLREELTTQQAAEILSVSRPYLIDLLDQGAIPFRSVGTHRRIRLSDLMRFKRSNDAKRRRALRELAAQAQELNMGY